MHPGKANNSNSFVPRDTSVSTTKTHVVSLVIIREEMKTVI